MEAKKFMGLLILIVPQVLDLITKNCPSCEEIVAIEEFYSSKVYALLEQEETKVWHFSALTLFNMYMEERETGTFVIPEEAG